MQLPAEAQDADTGEAVITWQDLATVWAAIEPLSALDFVAAQAEQSKVRARIIIRYRADVEAKMRVYNAAKHAYYGIEGIFPDKESGLNYLMLITNIVHFNTL